MKEAPQNQDHNHDCGNDPEDTANLLKQIKEKEKQNQDKFSAIQARDEMLEPYRNGLSWLVNNLMTQRKAIEGEDLTSLSSFERLAKQYSNKSLICEIMDKVIKLGNIQISSYTHYLYFKDAIIISLRFEIAAREALAMFNKKRLPEALSQSLNCFKWEGEALDVAARALEEHYEVLNGPVLFKIQK